jgi:hypothetical protein
MKVETSCVTKLYVTEVPSLDPITVFLENFGSGQGKLIVECYGQSWSAFWGGMGTDLLSFIRQANSDYIACKMFTGAIQVYDPETLESTLKKEVLRRRFARDLTQQEAWELMYKIETSDFEHPFHLNSQMMADLVGDDWRVAMPVKDNPDFVYLKRIIDTVKLAIAQ